MKDYSLQIQKVKSGVVKDLTDDFGIVCTKIPLPSNLEANELYSQTWPEEDGEDVYFPDSSTYKPFDWEIEMAARGGSEQSAYEKVRGFIDYLMGRDADGGTDLRLFSRYVESGCASCYVKKCTITDHWKDMGDGIVLFKVMFHVVGLNVVTSSLS